MASMLLQKPSRAHNLSYLLLGYYLSSLVTYGLNLSLDQKVLVVAALGSLIGTLVYYIKPIERAISLFYRISKKNRAYLDEPFEDELGFPLYKSDILYSSYLQDERTKINGAFFLALGMLTTNNLLGSVGLLNMYWLLVLMSFVLISVGVWEIYQLVRRKMPIITFFYNYYNISKNIPLLEKAIQKKDWIEAEKIMEKEPELVEPLYYYTYMHGEPSRGVCIECQTVREGRHCIECGEEILKKCPNCDSIIVEKEDTIMPKYCKFCGRKIERKSPS